MSESNKWTPGWQSRETVGLAKSFAKIAKNDLRGSWILYKRGLYPQAVFLFQQAVEKDLKAIGLLIGTVSTSDDLLKKVGHASILALMIGMPALLKKLPEMQQSIREGILDNPKIRAVGISEEVSKIFSPLLAEPSVDIESARRAVEQVRSLDAGRAWATTLEFNVDQKGPKMILAMLKEADEKCKQADEAEVLSKRLHKLIFKRTGIITDEDFVEYLLNINDRALPEAIPLGILTM